MSTRPDNLLSIAEVRERLGVSASTVWRLIRRGRLRSVRQGGRRLVPATALRLLSARHAGADIPPLTAEHSIFRLVGAGRSGGVGPGARDKHAILDR
jgi:excisionase family DNA binding protein